MLDVYFDEENIRKLSTLIRKDTSTDFATESISFLRKKCNLFINDVRYHSQNQIPKYLSIFQQGRGVKAKFDKFVKGAELLNAASPHSVFLIQQDNEFFMKINNKFACSNNDDADFLSTLLFLKVSQQKRFVLDKSLKDQLSFNGWQDFMPHNLLPLTDIVIIDQYFLSPSKKYYDVYASFLNESFMPLLKILQSKSIGQKLNMSVFTSNKVENSMIEPDECYYLIKDLLEGLSIGIDFTLVIPKDYVWHERYLYMNYQGVDPKLSLHGFKFDRIVAKDDRLIIYPYAEDAEAHAVDLIKLWKLAMHIKKNKCIVYGSGNNNLLPF